jgi:hypothetical protein
MQLSWSSPQLPFLPTDTVEVAIAVATFSLLGTVVQLGQGEKRLTVSIGLK